MTITHEKVWARTLAALTLGAASIALAGCSLLGGGTPTDTETGSPEGETTDVFTIKVGDCLNGESTGEVSDVPVVECTEPHDREAYASIIIDDGDFPGDDVVKQQAVDGCQSEFDAFVGMAYDDSTLDFAYFYPTETSWAGGDREILCLIGDPAGQVTGSLAGAAY